MQVNDSFMVQRMGSEDGPYSVTDLQAQVRGGVLRSNTLLRKSEGGGTWFVASEIPGLFSDREYLTTSSSRSSSARSGSIASTSGTRGSGSSSS